MNKRCLGCMEMIEDSSNVCPHCGYVKDTPAENAMHLHPGTVLHEHFLVGKVVGFGGFGVTYLGWDLQLQQKVAIKEYLPSEFCTRVPGVSQVSVFNGKKTEQFGDGKHSFVDEAKRLAKLQKTDGIVHIFDSFDENNTAYIVMEYLEGETLATRLERCGTLDSDETIQMMLPIIEALEAVHSVGMIHRDIAPDNIFLTTSGRACLIDFGAARYASSTHSKSLSIIVKEGYSPVEQYGSRTSQGAYTDVYALAATMYRAITGEVPPISLERKTMLQNGKKDILVPPSKLNKEIAISQENALLNAMNVRVEDRTPDMAAFAKELKADKVKRRVGGGLLLDRFHWPKWAKILVPTMAVLLITFGVLLFTGIIKFDKDIDTQSEIPEDMTRVPALVNQDITTAQERVDASQLQYQIIGKEYSDQIAVDLVLSQNLEGGSLVTINTYLQLIISAGVEKVPMPSLVGLSKEDAVELLIELGFLVEEEEVYSNSVAKGNIIEQSIPKDEMCPVGETITITISAGVDPEKEIGTNLVTVPDFVGNTYEDALKTAEALGIILSIQEKKYSDEIAMDVIMEQDCAGGAEVVQGTEIKLTVSLGKELITITDLQYMEESEAVEWLKAKGLAYKIEYAYDNAVAVDRVVTQSPEANVAVEKDTVVQLVVSLGKKDVTIRVPNVVGTNVSEATKTLTDKGFLVEVEEKFDANVAAGKVISQSPEGGVSKTPGTKVTLTVSKGKQGVTITYDANGGTVTTVSKTVYLSSEYGTLAEPIRVGYTFNGWYTSATGGTKVTASTVVTKNVAHTLYAQWTTNTYTIAFNANGGTVASSSKSVSYGSTYGTLPTPTRTGHTFNGWYTSASGGRKVSTSTAMEASNVTLYAQWTANTYTIAFDANGGTVASSSKSVSCGSTYGTLPTPTRTGYTFNGWYTSASGGRKVSTSTTMEASNVTLYAQWTANTYTITFNVNGNGGTVTNSSKSVSYGSTYGTLPTPTRDYYSFNGWYTAASGGSKVSSATTMEASDVTLYAQWTINALSDWVPASDIPSGAQVVNTEWRYTLTEYTTSSSSSLSGWTLYNTVRTSWGSWSGWSTTNPSNGLRNVESRTEYHYYRWINGNGMYTYQYNSSYWLEEKWFTYTLPLVSGYTVIGYESGTNANAAKNWWCRADYSGNRSVSKTFTRTTYRYQEPIYTYYFYRELSKKSTSNPTGTADVSNVVKYVQYRTK